MSLCSDFNSSFVGSSSVITRLSFLSKNIPQSLRRKRWQPSIPFVSQGFDCSIGPRNISYIRSVSAPYFSTMISGFTTLNIDLLIFSTAHPQIYLSFSRMNSALAYSGRQARNASMSSTSFVTMFTSTCNGVTSYSFDRFSETNVFVSFIR